MMVGGEKPPLRDLQHHGVKGMHWGVRKAEQAANPQYTTKMRAEDRRTHGKRAVSRINRRLNEGLTREQALERERERDALQQLAVAGALFVTSVLASHGSTNMSTLITERANNNRTAAAVGIAAKATQTPFVKPSRGGVYNITTKK